MNQLAVDGFAMRKTRKQNMEKDYLMRPLAGVILDNVTQGNFELACS